MRTLLAMLMVVLSALSGRAQERVATMHLDDGQVLQGRVVAMDLESVQIEVDGVVRKVPSASIKSYRFGDAVASEAAPVAAEPVVTRPRLAATPAEPYEVLVAAALDPEQAPHDLRNRKLWRARLEAVDEMYPWLCPTAPSQWFSLGLLLFVACTFGVRVSVSVCGAEQPELARCIALAVWYLVAAFMQVATVPALHLTTVAMLVLNPAMALFGMRQLFGLTRGGAVLALAIQLGFVLVGYGILELIDAALKTVDSAHP